MGLGGCQEVHWIGWYPQVQMEDHGDDTAFHLGASKWWPGTVSCLKWWSRSVKIEYIISRVGFREPHPWHQTLPCNFYVLLFHSKLHYIDGTFFHISMFINILVTFLFMTEIEFHFILEMKNNQGNYNKKVIFIIFAHW